jgi:hypothetical protein
VDHLAFASIYTPSPCPRGKETTRDALVITVTTNVRGRGRVTGTTETAGRARTMVKKDEDTTIDMAT